MNSLNAKVFLITGAASGIGEALARLLDSKNVTLLLNDVDELALNKVAKSLTQEPLLLPFSVASKDEWAKAKAKIDLHFNRSSAPILRINLLVLFTQAINDGLIACL
jgi:NADP-dependent 3-hydroxy acid dehydrogenase YdfG